MSDGRDLADGRLANVVDGQRLDALANKLLHEDAKDRCRVCDVLDAKHEAADHEFVSYVRTESTKGQKMTRPRGYVEASRAAGIMTAKRMQVVVKHEALGFTNDELDSIGNRQHDRRSTRPAPTD